MLAIKIFYENSIPGMNHAPAAKLLQVGQRHYENLALQSIVSGVSNLTDVVQY